MSAAQDKNTSLKGALHCHTTKSDGKQTPEEVLETYHSLGYDFVALTDHDFLMMPNAYKDVPSEFSGMLVFKGIERTIFARGYLHYNEIVGKDEVLNIFNHPAEYDFTVEQMLERMIEVEETVEIHAVEVSLKGFYTAEYDIPEIPQPKVVSDDSHTREMCGRAWVWVDAEKEHDAILRAIKAGKVENEYKWVAQQATWKNQGGSQVG